MEDTSPRSLSESDLTDNPPLEYLLSLLLSEGEAMKGAIRYRGNCRNCGGDFLFIRKLGFICPECKTRPERFYLDLPWAGKRVRIYSDKQGQPLDTYDRARGLQAHINAEIKSHTFDPSRYLKAELSRFYFSAVAQIWLKEKLKEVEQGLKAYSYVKELVAYNDRYFGPFFKDKDIRDIRRYDIDEFKASFPAHLSPKTIKNIFIALKNLFITAHRKEIIERVPSFPEIHVPEYTGWKWIDAETQVKILDVIAEKHRAIFVFLFLHGCRPGEARALKAKDIDFQTGTIRIRRTFSLNKLRETTKQKRQNIIPIHPEFAPYLKEHLKLSLPEAFIFMNPITGKPYNDETLRKIWHRGLKASNLEKSNLRLYDASRHSFASQLVNSSVPLNIVSKLLGHSSLKMTQRYAHESIDTMKIAIQNLSLSSKPTVSGLSLAKK
ncbi:MAG: tyrosine-type recombinase/integrase [Desulfobacteraceae bacterium]|nr:tyrosine-type recombinase/integrase [Desulfobacteraceae bacterium]